MRKLTLFCSVTDREAALDTIQRLGVVHLNHIQSPQGADIEQARHESEQLRRAFEALPRPRRSAPPSGRAADHAVQEIMRLIQEKADLEEETAQLSKEILRVFPFGSFDPATILRLEKSGIFIRLYAAGVRDRPIPPEDSVLIELSRASKKVYLALIGRKDARLEAEEIPLPSMSLKALRNRLEEARERLRQNEKRLRQFSGDRQVLLDALHHARDRVLYLEARSGMGSAAKIAYLQGYFPRPKEKLIRETANREGWGFLIEDPGEQDQPPTLIENPRWVRPVEFIFDGIGILPGYRETDISLPFLVFFSLFFSMLVGDAGYGCLFLLFTSLARLRFKEAPRAPFLLMWVMGLGTVAWGVLSGNYFGMQPVHPWLAQWRLDWLSGPRGEVNLIFFCFLVGAVHLTLAHFWKLAQLINSWRAAAHLGWIGTTWVMFFLARAVVLEKPFPPLMVPVFIVSAVCILVFMIPFKQVKKEWISYVMFPLSIVSNFVDIVSYVRLFAVGAATFAVASAFNQMAANWGFESSFNGLVAALILFFGHALNILLATMGVLVHGIRLNTLEFAGHLGLQWTGTKYRPFAKSQIES